MKQIIIIITVIT